ncbi:hypothetical protein F5Y14DRAFT_412345 [Nemania sp. NC0429]|nr:hypothetical protein F5Y14DRAFT_412345 [Nemania sp. NC0429]
MRTGQQQQQQKMTASTTRTNIGTGTASAAGIRAQKQQQQQQKILPNLGASKSTVSLATTPTSPDTPTPTPTPTTGASANTSSSASILRTTRSSSHLRPPPLVVSRTARPTHIPAYPVYCQIAQATQLERDVRRNIVLARPDASLELEAGRWSYAPRAPAEEPRVRIEVRLERPFLDVRRWKEWILRAPAEAREIEAKMVMGGGGGGNF